MIVKFEYVCGLSLNQQSFLHFDTNSNLLAFVGFCLGYCLYCRSPNGYLLLYAIPFCKHSKTHIVNYLSAVGRIFFGLCICVIGVLHFIYPGFRPIIVPKVLTIPSGFSWIIYVAAIVLIFSGLLIIIGKKFQTVSLIMGIVFLILFLFVHLPVFLSAGPDNADVWINFNKVLALSGGFFLLSTINAPRYENSTLIALQKIGPLGVYFFAMMLYNFSVIHIVSMNGISKMVPEYIPFPKFWTIMGGIALMGTAISIYTRYRTNKINLLLAGVLFIWLLSLHLYYAVRYPEWKEGENITGVITCMAFCGIALMISQRKLGGVGKQDRL